MAPKVVFKIDCFPGEQVVSLWPDVDPSVLNSGGLSVEAADTMVENCIGCVSLSRSG